MYKCKLCNSSDVEELMWVNMNTNLVSDEPLKDCGLDDLQDHFCNDCEHLTTVFIDEEI